MPDATWTTLQIAWVAVAVTLGVLGVAWLARRRPALGISLLALALFMLAASRGVAAELEDAALDDTVTVQGLDPTSDPAFSVDIKHVWETRSDAHYAFHGAGDEAAVLAAFEAQHPDGVAAEPDATVGGALGTSIWHVSTNNMRFELIESPNAGTFGVVTQAARVVAADGRTSARIPFPVTAYGPSAASEVTTLVGDWTADDWRAFYADITDARISGDTITVPTDLGGTVTLTLAGDAVSFTIDD